MNINYTAKKC